MATIAIWKNYEVIDGVKIFVEYKETSLFEVPKMDGRSYFDSAKLALWAELDRFMNEFNTLCGDGHKYAFNPSEMDLLSDSNHEYFGRVEGFEYDDGVTLWSATIYENYEF